MTRFASALPVLVLALSGCAGATLDPVADTATSTTIGTAAPTITAPTTTTTTVPSETTTTVAQPVTTTTTGAPEVLTATGVVIDVSGDLTATTAITILDGDGTQMVFVPSTDATFHGGPLSHIRDHLLNGLPVVVDYVVLADGTLEAISFDDADHDH